MDAGKAVEFEHPYLLLQVENGVFSQLVAQTGAGMAETLMAVAENSYKTVFHDSTS